MVRNIAPYAVVVAAGGRRRQGSGVQNGIVEIEPSLAMRQVSAPLRAV